VERGGKDALRGDFCTSDKPFFFSVALPEGNYNVTVTLGDAAGASTTTIKAELRRLLLEEVHTAKGRFATRTFTVNIRTPQIAGGGEVKLKDREKTTEIWNWDEKLTLEFNNTSPKVCALEITPADHIPTVFLLGDSTVCDQPREPYNSWGQMLPRFFRAGVAVANHAESGESLRSSLGAKRLDKVLSLMKPGDYLFIQYGHNDEKEKGAGVGAFTTYKASLKRFVEEARKHGGTVVLITPMHRLTFDAAGQITNSHGDYPEAVRQAAKEENVPLIDLNVMSKPFYEALGPAEAKKAFAPGDATHHNNYGSYELAKCIVEGIKADKLGLVKYLVRDVPPFKPGRPDAIASFHIPPSPLNTDVKPLGN
jgi:lysophospholipase L1-like esterase